MDCHEYSSDNWQLLGVYKEAFYADQWMEQLFKHAGYCLWDEDTYEFMQDYRESWPEGCMKSGATTSSGHALYIDLKPGAYGTMDWGLYEDAACMMEYQGNDKNVYTLVAKLDDFLTGDYLSAWNQNMNSYKQCQPCRATDSRSSSYYRHLSYYDKYYNNNNNNNGNNNNNDDNGDNDPNEGYFTCEDDAGYTNVNQCMKFRTHTYLEVATWSDLQLATDQGGIVPINVNGKTYGIQQTFETLEQEGPPSTQPYLVAGYSTLGTGITVFGSIVAWIIVRHRQSMQQSVTLSEPLV